MENGPAPNIQTFYREKEKQKQQNKIPPKDIIIDVPGAYSRA